MTSPRAVRARPVLQNSLEVGDGLGQGRIKDRPFLVACAKAGGCLGDHCGALYWFLLVWLSLLFPEIAFDLVMLMAVPTGMSQDTGNVASIQLTSAQYGSSRRYWFQEV